MMLPRPASLFAQTLTIVAVGLLLSYGIGMWMHLGDRSRAVRAIGGFATAQRVANSVQLIEDAPLEWRPRLLAGLGDPGFRVALSATPPAAEAEGDGNDLERMVAFYLGRRLGRRVRVWLDAAPAPQTRPMMMMMGNGGPWRRLAAAVEMKDGVWMTVVAQVPDSPPGGAPDDLPVVFLAMGAVVLAASAWAVRRVARPLATLAAAADRLGQDLDAPALPEQGSAEMRRAARAFNLMQDRLRAVVETRTRMLAGLSHDLRTPLTLLRLRAEALPDGIERDRMLAAIADMDAMVGAALAFVRDEAAAEPARKVDIAALVQSIVDDRADGGQPVTLAPCACLVASCRPQSLKRAIGNVIDNALAYGGAAHLAVEAAGDRVRIDVCDDGPGIAEADLEKAMQPFVRLDPARGEGKGGIGLGLALAKSAAHAQNGDLVLFNRPQGGLCARLTVPL